MTTKPPGVKQILYLPQGGTDLIPIQPQNWKYFCTKEAAQALTTKITQLPYGITATCAVDGEQSAEYVLRVPGQDIQMYNIAGVIQEGSIPVSENAGWLIDRQTNPVPGIDENPDSSLGGPNLLYKVSGGVAQLYWGKATS